MNKLFTVLAAFAVIGMTSCQCASKSCSTGSCDKTAKKCCGTCGGAAKKTDCKTCSH
jgi:hypothetical protein